MASIWGANWGVKAKTVKRDLSVTKQGAFKFHEVLGQQVINTIHDEFERIMHLSTPRSTEEATKLLKIFSNNDFFRQFPLDVNLEILKYIELHSYYKGQAVVKQGEKGYAIYVVNSGLTAVQVKPKDIRQRAFIVMNILPGNSFGKLGLLGDGIRKASVISMESNTKVLKIPELCTAVLKEFWHNSHMNTVKFLLRHLPLRISSQMHETDLLRLVEKMHVEVFQRGQVIVTEGQNVKVRKFYFLLNGSARLLKRVDNKGVFGQVGEGTPGYCFGYDSLNVHRVPKYSVVADSRVICWTAATSDFLDLLDARVVALMSDYVHSFDLDRVELRSELQRKEQWSGWKNTYLHMVDDQHNKKTEEDLSHQPTPTEVRDAYLAGLGYAQNNYRLSPKKSPLKQQQQQQKHQQSSTHSAQRRKRGSPKKRNKKKPQEQHQTTVSRPARYIDAKNGDIQAYDHVTHEQFVAGPSAQKLIHKSLSSVFHGHRSTGDDTTYTQEQDEQHLLDVINRNYEKAQQKKQLQQEEQIHLAKRKARQKKQRIKHRSSKLRAKAAAQKSRVFTASELTAYRPFTATKTRIDPFEKPTIQISSKAGGHASSAAGGLFDFEASNTVLPNLSKKLINKHAQKKLTVVRRLPLSMNKRSFSTGVLHDTVFRSQTNSKQHENSSKQTTSSPQKRNKFSLRANLYPNPSEGW